MQTFIFWLAVFGFCSYLWVDRHNHQQKQDFYQTIDKCQKQVNSKPKEEQEDIICLADGMPCQLQKEWENVQGMLCLAQNYRIGRELWFHQQHFGKDLQKSAYWYEQLAFKGHQEAQFEMANILEHGIGVEKDLQNANSWYYQAYLSGNLEAGFIFANHLEQGKGIDKNHQQALFLYHELANIYYKPAIFKMGEIYYKGLFGIEKNRDIALQFFQKIPNYQGVSGLDGMLSKIQREISIESAMAQKQLELQIPQQQYLSNANKTYSSDYYGYSTECTAICWDGTCSKSLGQRGVCSHHGGVRYWLK